VATSSNEDGRCQRVGLAGAVNDFMYRRPCATRRQFELDLAPDSLTSGTHTIRARVYDAAGNALTVYGPRRIAVTSSSVKGAASSTARFVPEGSSRIVANFGKRVRIAGRLETNLGEPIAGAPITVTMTSSSASRTKVVRTLHTDADGRYELTARATANRSIEFSHEASGALLTGSLKVHSQIALRAAKRHVKSLGKMRLTGRVPGERAKRGATVAIKVRSGRGWRTVAVARTDRSGAFKFTYRFRRVSHATLKFRAVALASGDLTVDPRPSRALRIRVG
jgi:hypothetical protein